MGDAALGIGDDALFAYLGVVHLVADPRPGLFLGHLAGSLSSLPQTRFPQRKRSVPQRLVKALIRTNPRPLVESSPSDCRISGIVRDLSTTAIRMNRSLGEEPRPSWAAFYGSAELVAITAIVRDRIGDSGRAEAASHRALAGVPKQFRRNRAMATTRLALAQLRQRDIDQVCATASTVFDLMNGDLLPGRMRSLLGDYYRDLITLAPDARIAQEWGDRFRSEWSRS